MTDDLKHGLVLTLRERKRARHLIHATAYRGADATSEMLADFRPEAWPALIAFLAGVASEATVPVVRTAWRRGQPDVLTPAQRRYAHRRYAEGDRSASVVAGEREYHRVRARRKREEKA